MGGAKKTSSAAVRKRPQLPTREPEPLFFSFERARISDPLTISKVVTVVLPLSHIRDRAALHEYVLKKLLHKPYEPSQEERVAAQTHALSTSSSPSLATAVQHDTRCEKDTVKGEDAPHYVIVHVESIEVHADTVRQANTHGDLQLNVLVTMTAARVVHGLLVGVAADSPFGDCMQAVVSLASSGTGKSLNEINKSTPGRSTSASSSATLQDGGEETGSKDESFPSSTIVLTVRCLQEEPVVAGQAVFVASEPGGGMRCLAIRPPRKALGPFKLVPDVGSKMDQKRVRVDYEKPVSRPAAGDQDDKKSSNRWSDDKKESSE